MNQQAEFDFNAPPRETQPASAETLAKLKKLLRFGADKRGNPKEAETAMRMAWEMARRHRIDLASLDLDEETQRIVHDHFHMGERFDEGRRRVFAILETFFNVTLCLCKPRLLVIGKPCDVEIARYVHDFLLREHRNCLRAYERSEQLSRRRMSPRKRAGYIAGFFYGIVSNLNEAEQAMPLTDAQNAIVLAEEAERQRRLDELIPRRKTLKLPDKKLNENALEAGYRDGKSTQINKPLGAGSAPETLALPAHA
jgi:Protein of unknown function (DUF2786)